MNLLILAPTGKFTRSSNTSNSSVSSLICATFRHSLVAFALASETGEDCYSEDISLEDNSSLEG